MTTTTTKVRRTGRLTDGMRNGWTRPYKTPCFHPRRRHPCSRNGPANNIASSALAAIAPSSDIFAPGYINGLWPTLLRERGAEAQTTDRVVFHV